MNLNDEHLHIPRAHLHKTLGKSQSILIKQNTIVTLNQNKHFDIAVYLANICTSNNCVKMLWDRLL